MPQLAFERRVQHSPGEMMSLVADVRSYPGFVPNCTDMSVKAQPSAEPASRFLAKMTAALGPLTQTYTSQVEADPARGTISVKALDGPFSHLDSLWQFSPDGEGTRVRFEIDFGFSNRLLAAVAEPAFAAKQTEIMDAFIKEADRRFG